jgi:hypothetical protein
VALHKEINMGSLVVVVVSRAEVLHRQRLQNGTSTMLTRSYHKSIRRSKAYILKKRLKLSNYKTP